MPCFDYQDFEGLEIQIDNARDFFGKNMFFSSIQ